MSDDKSSTDKSGPARTTALAVRNVALAYQRGARLGTRSARTFWALEDVSFELRFGEVLGVIGRNGAGKTSLLRVLAGILAPDRGSVWRRPGLVAAIQAPQVGFIQQLTGRENAILSGILLGLTYGEVAERMQEIVAYAELAEVIDEPLWTYSAGMCARLGFSVAFFSNPDVILLDEALGAGDAAFRAKSDASMRDRLRHRGTVVLVSHNESTIRQLCSRAVLIHDGVSVADGKVEEVLAEYRGHQRAAVEGGAGSGI